MFNYMLEIKTQSKHVQYISINTKVMSQRKLLKNVREICSGHYIPAHGLNMRASRMHPFAFTFSL